MAKKKPVKFVRNDGEEFTLNNDGNTYSLEFMKKEYPASRLVKYNAFQLAAGNFTPVYK